MRESTVARLVRLAEQRHLSSEEMAALVIEEFVDREEWHLAEIEAAVAEADQGDFASDEDVAAVLFKYAGSSPAK